MSFISAALVVALLLIPTILAIQAKALSNPVLFFILLIAFVGWAVTK